MRYIIILAGGSGTRFWPFSREFEPKQFMQVVGRTSLFQDTIKRVSGFIPAKNIYIITNFKYLYEVREHLLGFSIPQENIILEPQGKNTAPAVALCARLILKKDPVANLIVLPADHYIKDNLNFKKCLKTALSIANDNYLVTIGIKPLSPSTGYGYIKTGSDKGNYYFVERFLEKPDYNKATRYFKDKAFYWNSGIFVWKAAVFLDEVKRYLPNLYKFINLINSVKDIERVWPNIEPISLDYGILEHSKKIAMVPAKFYWSDLGSWDTLDHLLKKDKKNNLLQGNCFNLDCSGVSVFSRSSRLISVIGLKNIIIADTPDALLVCDKNKTQDVKTIVEKLKEKKRKECVTHITEKRPWGRFTILESQEGFKIKLIEIYPHKRLSLQKHNKRAEHWVVVAGCAKVTCGKSSKLVRSNNSIYVPQGKKHRLENPRDLPLKIVEVQTGGYLEEDDIVRFSDDFTR